MHAYPMQYYISFAANKALIYALKIAILLLPKEERPWLLYLYSRITNAMISFPLFMVTEDWTDCKCCGARLIARHYKNEHILGCGGEVNLRNRCPKFDQCDDDAFSKNCDRLLDDSIVRKHVNYVVSASSRIEPWIWFYKDKIIGGDDRRKALAFLGMHRYIRMRTVQTNVGKTLVVFEIGDRKVTLSSARLMKKKDRATAAGWLNDQFIGRGNIPDGRIIRLIEKVALARKKYYLGVPRLFDFRFSYKEQAKWRDPSKMSLLFPGR